MAKFFIVSPKKGITLGAGKKIFEIAGRTNDMGLDEIVRLVTGIVKDRGVCDRFYKSLLQEDVWIVLGSYNLMKASR